MKVSITPKIFIFKNRNCVGNKKIKKILYNIMEGIVSNDKIFKTKLFDDEAAIDLEATHK